MCCRERKKERKVVIEKDFYWEAQHSFRIVSLVSEVADWVTSLQSKNKGINK